MWKDAEFNVVCYTWFHQCPLKSPGVLYILKQNWGAPGLSGVCKCLPKHLSCVGFEAVTSFSLCFNDCLIVNLF